MTTTGTRPLFRRYPALADGLAWLPLGDLPTPAEESPVLAGEIGLDELWIKRDDLSAADYGGNKIRKLEFLLADARASGCTTVLTYGGLGSNHALATAINCRKLGLACVAILTPEPVTAAVRRTLAYHVALGTRLELARNYTDIAAATERLRGEITPAPCEIPFGGSSWRGTAGFVNAAFELAEQIAAGKLLPPDVIYLPCGTAGSVAGLALGLRLAALDIQIEAVQVTPDSLAPVQLTTRLFEQTNAELHARNTDLPLLQDALLRINVRNDQLGEGYAMPTPAATEAQAIVQEATGLPVSLTYTAKALAALIADARAGLLRGKRAMFWNTYNSAPYPVTAPLNPAQLPAELREFLQ